MIYYRIATQFDFGLVPEHLTGYRVVSQRMSSNRPRMFASFHAVTNEMYAAYPHRKATINSGTRYYLRFLIGEALTFQDFAQVWPLLSPWVREHPLDLIAIPLHVFVTKVAFRLRWIFRPLFSRPAATTRKEYSIGEPQR